jgi:hypothetical protein
LKVNRRFGGTYSLKFGTEGQAKKETRKASLVSYLAYSSTLKIETCSTENSLDFQWTTQRYIPEDVSPDNFRCKEG